MTLDDFRKATADLAGDTEILYAHTWRSLKVLQWGSYLGTNTRRSLILGTTTQEPGEYGNTVLFDGDDPPDLLGEDQ